MSKYTDDLEQIVLEHQRTIELYEARLDSFRDNDDLQALAVRSQIEFLLLNVRSALTDKQNQLEHMREMEKMASNPPGYYPVSYPTAPARPSSAPGERPEQAPSEQTVDVAKQS